MEIVLLLAAVFFSFFIRFVQTGICVAHRLVDFFACFYIDTCIDFSPSSSRFVHGRLDHPTKCTTTTRFFTMVIFKHVYSTIKLRVAAASSLQTAASLLVVTHRCIAWSCRCVAPSVHNVAALVVFTQLFVHASTPSSSALVVISHQVLLRLLRASPPRLLHAAAIAYPGRCSSYLYIGY
uniref:Uncharacterized protein n=1 Tax=Leersia perrieri TaxID=77586 RepID=A0A0D9XTS5_9ORYZ